MNKHRTAILQIDDTIMKYYVRRFEKVGYLTLNQWKDAKKIAKRGVA